MIKNTLGHMGHRGHSKGFTLIELLVVIAIIGILSSVVLASLNSARAKSRDARRIADVKQIQTALELYYDASSSSYPVDIYASSGGLATQYIPVVPKDPSTGANYPYKSFTTTTGTACSAAPCVYYHLGTKLEQGANSGALLNDKDSEIAALSGDTVDGVSTGAACASDAAATATTDLCYDVTP